MMRRFMTRHPVAWRAIDDRKMVKWAGQLEDAGDEAHAQMTSSADEAHRLDAVKALASVVKTGIMASRVKQVEELKREEWDRLDAGLATSRADHRHLHAHVEVAKPEVREAVRTLHRALKAARTDGP